MNVTRYLFGVQSLEELKTNFYPLLYVNLCSIVVKLQSKLNSLVQVGQGADFVFPLSQQQEQEEEEEPSPKSTRTKCTTDLEFGT